MACRRANFDILAGLLPDAALFRGSSADFVPFGFPVRIARRDAVWQALCARRVFPARYWPALPSDPGAFPTEHALSREILVLPCDQRYDSGDMRLVAAAYRESCG